MKLSNQQSYLENQSALMLTGGDFYITLATLGCRIATWPGQPCSRVHESRD